MNFVRADSVNNTTKLERKKKRGKRKRGVFHAWVKNTTAENWEKRKSRVLDTCKHVDTRKGLGVLELGDVFFIRREWGKGVLTKGVVTVSQLVDTFAFVLIPFFASTFFDPFIFI